MMMASEQVCGDRKEERIFTDIVGLLNSGKLIKVCAPMVRYSKLPFRLTVREYDTDVCYTPMILADSFMHSAIARDLEFQACATDTPVVVQFAARTAHEFANAYQLVAPFVDGVDLNCGCPQGWALTEGIGAGLMQQPGLICDMVRTARQRSSCPTPISVKMRIFDDPRRMVDLAQAIQAAGAAWITVHGRTRQQRSSEPVNYDMITLVRESVKIPVIANGDIDSLATAKAVALQTGVQGVMSARGLLENPALFAGHEKTPWECIDKFINYSLQYGSTGSNFQHHLAKMTTNILDSEDHRTLYSVLSSACIPTIVDFIHGIKGKYS